MKHILFFAFILTFYLTVAQEKIAPLSTFSSTRAVNGHSIETLHKKDLDIRITHRFGDLAGSNGGFQTLYGIDQAADIRIAGEYGISDQIMVGAGRAKGGGPILSGVFDGFVKGKILTQKTNSPLSFSISALGITTITSMQSSSDPTSPTNFSTFTRRISYGAHMLLAKKIGDRIALQLSPGYTHRNFVSSEDQNGILSLNNFVLFKLSKVISLAFEYTAVFRENNRVGTTEYTNPFAIGIIFDTGGHIFQLDITNSTGIGENQFIPYTYTSWNEGEFRLGFTISRPFKL